MSDLLIIIVFAVYLAGVLLYSFWFFITCSKAISEWYKELVFPRNLASHIDSVNIDSLCIMYDSIYGVGEHRRDKFKERMRKALNKVYVKNIENAELTARINELIEQVEYYSLLSYQEKDTLASINAFIDSGSPEDAKARLKTLALLLQERTLALEKLGQVNSFGRKANLAFFFINLIIAGVSLTNVMKL